MTPISTLRYIGLLSIKKPSNNHHFIQQARTTRRYSPEIIPTSITHFRPESNIMRPFTNTFPLFSAGVLPLKTHLYIISIHCKTFFTYPSSNNQDTSPFFLSPQSLLGLTSFIPTSLQTFQQMTLDIIHCSSK